MNGIMWWLQMLVRRWCRDLTPAEFKIAAYFWRWAAETPDGVVRRPKKEIAQATKIRVRNIPSLLQGLAKRGVFDVVSLAVEETVVRVPREHWLVPPPASEVKCQPTIANLKELLFRLAGVRVGVKEVEELKKVAEVDDQGLMEVLDSLLRRGRGLRYQGLGLLTVAVIHDAAVQQGRFGFW
jgi:hypothetical protein